VGGRHSLPQHRPPHRHGRGLGDRAPQDGPLRRGLGARGPHEGADEGEQLDWPARVAYAGQAVKDIVGKVWLYVVAGIAVGAVIHGYVPEDFMAGIMGEGA